MTELTDSGVSVISKDSRHMNWPKSDQMACSSGSSMTSSVSKPSVACNKKGIRMQPFIGDPGMPLLPQPHTVSKFKNNCFQVEMFFLLYKFRYINFK